MSNIICVNDILYMKYIIHVKVVMCKYCITNMYNSKYNYNIIVVNYVNVGNCVNVVINVICVMYV